MKYYFAYGADLNGEEFEKICPSLEKIASARLDDYEFFLDESGKPNIKKSANKHVYGGIWRISDSDFNNLESPYSLGLLQTNVKIEKSFCGEGIPKDAEIFTCINKSSSFGICKDASLQDLFYGALDFDLPETYLEFTQRFYAKYVFIYSKLLMGYENDYITKKLKIKEIGRCQTCEKYNIEKSDGKTILKNVPSELTRGKGFVYKLNNMRQLDFFDGIFANREFFRRYPIRIKTTQGEIFLAWCYFKEEPLNLGILEVME